MNLKRSLIVTIIAMIIGSIIVASTVMLSNQSNEKTRVAETEKEIECKVLGGIWSDSMQGCFIEDSSMELPDDFIEVYDGRNIVKELELEHHYNPISEEFAEPMAKAMFTIRNMSENERGIINQNLIFLALENNGQLTVAQQTILDMSLLVDRPTSLCIELKSLDYCSRLITLESMYRLIELNYTTDETMEWMDQIIREMPTKNNLEELRKSLNQTNMETGN